MLVWQAQRPVLVSVTCTTPRVLQWLVVPAVKAISLMQAPAVLATSSVLTAPQPQQWLVTPVISMHLYLLEVVSVIVDMGDQSMPVWFAILTA